MALDTEFLVKMPLGQKLIILGVIVAVIGFSYWFFIDSKKKEEFSSLCKTLHDKEVNLASLRNQEQELNAIKKDIEIKKQELEGLKKKLPTGTEMEKLLLDINKEGESNGITFTDFRPTSERPAENNLYIEVPIKLKFRGNYRFVMVFFYNVTHKLERIVNFSGIHIQAPRGKKKAKGSEVEVSCIATTYKITEEAK